VGGEEQNATVSNLGGIKMPKQMEKYIDRMETVLYPTPKSPINCGICSASGKLTVSFSSTIQEKDIIRSFLLRSRKSSGCARQYIQRMEMTHE
jgi:NRPS condensation-like uncharacterized protein